MITDDQLKEWRALAALIEAAAAVDFDGPPERFGKNAPSVLILSRAVPALLDEVERWKKGHEVLNAALAKANDEVERLQKDYSCERELAIENLCYADRMRKNSDALRSKLAKAKEALAGVLIDDINGYGFDKLMKQTKELLKQHGGWQNGYAISAVQRMRDVARAALTEIDA